MEIRIASSIVYDDEKCFFCGREPKTTQPHLFLDEKGNEVEVKVPYCGVCLLD